MLRCWWVVVVIGLRTYIPDYHPYYILPQYVFIPVIKDKQGKR
jgi:hypothetical protein